MNTEPLETLEIPLSKLLAWNGNVRTMAVEEGIGELADSIAAVGLLQGLVVKTEPRGKYSVIAGRRRLLALSRLADDGKMKPTVPIPCRIAPKDADLPEISLTENVMRVPMHPADEFEAFQRLITAGKSAADVAARFGVTESVVLRRLALARVSPALLAKYRQDEMNLQMLQAFTLTDDHETQEAVWNQLHSWDRNPHTIRHMLVNNDIPANDKSVRFVGLANYEAAGGGIRRDLFAEGDQGTYITDSAMLTRLIGDRLQVLAENVKADGWKWVEVQPELNYAAISRCRRLHAPELPLSQEQQAELTELQEKRDAVLNGLQEIGEEEEEDLDAQPLYDRIDEIDGRMAAIRRNRRAAYSDDVKGICGVVVSIGQTGEPEFVYGLLRKEDEKDAIQAESTVTTDCPTSVEAKPERESSGLSAVLIETLTQHKAAAIAAELSRQPSIALAALVHALVLAEFGMDLHLYRAQSCLQVSSQKTYLEAANPCLALSTLDKEKVYWLERLGKVRDTLWQWCLEQDQETLLTLLAYCVSRTVNGVKSKADENSNVRYQQADALAAELRIDMTQWFTPNAENFYSKVSKSCITQAFAEAGKPLRAESQKLKKAELASLAESELKNTGWLPESIRIKEGKRGE